MNDWEREGWLMVPSVICAFLIGFAIVAGVAELTCHYGCWGETILTGGMMADQRYQYNIFDENSEWWAEVEGIGLGPLRAAQGYLAQTPEGFIERRSIGEWERVPAVGGTA